MKYAVKFLRDLGGNHQAKHGGKGYLSKKGHMKGHSSFYSIDKVLMIVKEKYKDYELMRVI